MERARLQELDRTLPTHLFTEGERGRTEKTSESNIIQWAAGMKQIQIKRKRPNWSYVKWADMEQ